MKLAKRKISFDRLSLILTTLNKDLVDNIQVTSWWGEATLKIGISEYSVDYSEDGLGKLQELLSACSVPVTFSFIS
jgi:hypothetical protein